MVTIRRLAPADWEAYREIRLAALRESPGAFGSTLAQEVDRQPEQWRGRLGRGACFVAFDGDRPVGIAYGIDLETLGAAGLVSMWVAPSARRGGLGLELVEQVAGWARAEGYRELVLTVVDDQLPARALYRRAGFTATGNVEPYPNDPARHEIELRLALTGRTDVGAPTAV